MTPEELMRRAIDLACKNASGDRGGPFSAIIVKDGEIVAEGTNLVTSTIDPTAHAEIVAIRKACTVLGSVELTGCELFASCEPCPMCLGAIYWSRLAGVYFSGTKKDAAAAGFDDAFICDQVCVPLEGRVLPMRRLLPEIGAAPFEAWEQNANRVPY